MIRSFGDAATEDVFHGLVTRRVHRWSADLRRSAQRKLFLIEGASRLSDLAVPPGNRLELLRGDMARFHSIRVNDQWRIIFRWIDGEAHDVSMIDYH